jgi:two-component system NtrC family sensor kinase
MTTEVEIGVDRNHRGDRLGGSRILIVDDLAANLRALAAVLESAGYREIECLNDSRQVLPAVARCLPDVILLDLHMPHFDGMAILQQLRTAVPQDDYLPVLVLTGDSSSEAKEMALAYGASDFLTKPLSHTEVELRVGNLLQTRWLHCQLRERNQSLEQQVRERTELADALGATNQRLRETQAHLVQSEKMASLGQLVAGIAHEINNPLAFVLNNIFVVRESLGRLEAEGGAGLTADLQGRLEKDRRRLGDMQEGAERVKDLVTKLRTFSRLDEGQFKTINIHESIESVLLFLQHKMEGRIQVERHYNAPDSLACFAGELNQVLMNLIANAIDSIADTGTITITTRHEDGNFIALVRDTGKGIPEEIRHRIFEPFFTTKPPGEGTGLGLAVSYGIVKAHRGSIECFSVPGKGTEFILKIPLSFSIPS